MPVLVCRESWARFGPGSCSAIFLALVLFLLFPTTVAAADCQFVLGFKTLRDLIGYDIVGECGENERYNSIGDSVQQTTGGLLVWRKADNWTAFTDGHRTWINGPNGLVRRHINERFKWELDYKPGGLSVVNCRSQGIVTETVLDLGASPPTATQADGPAPSLIALARGAGWYRDGVAYGKRSPEGEVLTVLEKIDRDSPHIARAAAHWQWLFDEDMERDEWHVIEYIARLDDYVPVYVPRLLALPWVHDGVDRMEAEMVSLLYREALCYGLDFAVQLATAPWVLDGIDAEELNALGYVRNSFFGADRIIPALFRKSWLLDGLTEHEKGVLLSLLQMSGAVERQEEEAALAILEMPFLNDSIDQSDTFVLRSLNELRHGVDRSYLGQVVSQFTLSGGITAADRGLVSMLGLVVSDNPKSHRPELLDIMLDPTRSRVEQRVIHLPRAGEVTLTVVHSRPGTFHTMDNLERTVRAQEEFMLEAFPVQHVGVLAAEVTPVGGGAYFGGGRIAIDPGGENNPHLVGHEVAHIYQLRTSPWLGEGGAEVLRAVAVGDPFRIENVELSLCHQAANLAEVDKLEAAPRPDKGPDDFPYVTLDCPYVMGFGLFVDLYANLGDWAFRQSFRRMHLKARDGEHEDTCVDIERAICLVRQAFVTDAASPRDAAIAEPIINRWYHGSIAEFRSRSR